MRSNTTLFNISFCFLYVDDWTPKLYFILPDPQLKVSVTGHRHIPSILQDQEFSKNFQKPTSSINRFGIREAAIELWHLPVGLNDFIPLNFSEVPQNSPFKPQFETASTDHEKHTRYHRIKKFLVLGVCDNYVEPGFYILVRLFQNSKCRDVSLESNKYSRQAFTLTALFNVEFCLKWEHEEVIVFTIVFPLFSLIYKRFENIAADHCILIAHFLFVN